MSNIRVSPSGHLYYTPSGHVGQCPEFVYEYSDGDCICYLNPIPGDWSESVTYALYDCAWHNSKYWYSTISGDNVGNEPGVDAGWTEISYISECLNSDWNSIPPFGGITKTPKYYIISVGFSQSYWLKTFYGDCEVSTLKEASTTANFFLVLEYNPGLGACVWSTIYTSDSVAACTWKYSGPGAVFPFDCSGERAISTGAYLVLCHYAQPYLTLSFTHLWWNSSCSNIGCSREIYCDHGRTINIDFCELEGSRTIQVNDPTYETSGDCIGLQNESNIETLQISWKPIDCDFTVWDSGTTYNAGDCVVWNGHFYRSCSDSNTGNEPESDATNICEIGYYWRLG